MDAGIVRELYDPEAVSFEMFRYAFCTRSSQHQLVMTEKGSGKGRSALACVSVSSVIVPRSHTLSAD